MAPTFIGGKLRLKGTSDGTKKIPKKAVQSTTKFEAPGKHRSKLESSKIVEDDGLTEAERKSLKIKLEREKAELEKLAHKSHRERVEEFNEKLSSLTELNDIPRVSAAGNG